jgi:TRAP-type C4-dicarboxylate transport system permease small subunit
MNKNMCKFLDGLLKVETLVAGVFYALAAGILFADVFSREILDSAIWGSQRIAVLFSNASALIGIGVAASMNRHIRPVILDKIFPESFVPMVERTGNAFAAFVLFSGCYFSILLVMGNYELGFTANPLALKIWIPQCALPYGMATAGLRYLIFALFPDTHPNIRTSKGIQNA